MTEKREFAYEKWLKLLRSMPPLYAVRVKNRYVIVNNYLTHLVKLRYLKRYEYRFRQMKDGSCMIFHYSNRHFGVLTKAHSVKTRFYDWNSIFNSVPAGYGRELNANYASVRGAIRRYEREGRLKRGEFRVLRLRERKKTRMILCHQASLPISRQ